MRPKIPLVLQRDGRDLQAVGEAFLERRSPADPSLGFKALGTKEILQAGVVLLY